MCNHNALQFRFHPLTLLEQTEPAIHPSPAQLTIRHRRSLALARRRREGVGPLTLYIVAAGLLMTRFIVGLNLTPQEYREVIMHCATVVGLALDVEQSTSVQSPLVGWLALGVEQSTLIETPLMIVRHS